MLSRVFIFFGNRSVQVTIATLYLSLLAALTGYLLSEAYSSPARLIVVEVFLVGGLSLLIERATSSAKGIAFLAANDLRISFGASAVFMVGGVLVTFFVGDSRSAQGAEGLTLPILVLYAPLGLLLGSNLRRFLDLLIARSIFGRPRFLVSMGLTTLWFMVGIIVFVPVNPGATGLFLFCVSFGIILHRGLTLRLTRAAAAYRRLFEVQSNVPHDLEISENERRALILLAAGRNAFTKRFSALRRHLGDCHKEGNVSRRLYLISACAWRLEGRYSDAIEDTRVAADPPQDDLDAQLLLIRALSLEDRDDQTDTEIDSLLDSISLTPPGKICPLTKALQARREAERSIDDGGMIDYSKKPLEKMVKSLDLRRGAGAILEGILEGHNDPATKFFRGFVAHGVPVTPSWLLDVFGYSLLIAGCPEEARVFLQRCISLDPDYSYGYLHLGDYFLFRRTSVAIGGNKAKPGNSGFWHAQVCYSLAERIEHSKASRVGRIARGRLKLLESLRRA